MTDQPNDKPIDVITRDVEHERAPQPEEQEQCHTLLDLGEHFEFFTTALLITHGLFDRDPLVEFNAAHPVDHEELRPYAIDSRFPFFQNLGQSIVGDQFVDWDHRLYAIERSRWPKCYNFINAISMFERRRHHYARVCSHHLTIVDPLALHGGKLYDALPEIEVTVFAVSTNRHFVHLFPAIDPPRTRAFPHVGPPREATILEGQAVLGPPPDPEHFAAILGKRGPTA